MAIIEMSNANKDEPNTAPKPDRWYNLSLGRSFKDDRHDRFCSLRYEFKPASIDKSKPGKLHKNKENRVSVEFQNNQPGKPKVAFVGSSEEYKDNDAVLFFDGETFRLERLHRAVNKLRHLRIPGDSTATASVVVAAPSGPVSEPRLSPVAKAKPQNVGKNKYHSLPVQVEVERIDIGEPELPATKYAGKKVADNSSIPPVPPRHKNYEVEEHEDVVTPGHKNSEVDEHEDIVIDDLDFGVDSPNKWNTASEQDVGFDTNIMHHQNGSDEIADVDDSGDEVNKGPNAAEALRAQVSAKEKEKETSSSSSSSGSSSNSSGSGSSSSSGSDSSDDDSVTSI